ncbi:ABC-type transporter, permease protein (nitrate/sulfonate/bicarbonate transporter) [Desulforapulum autotrophicum HRM2]|uniref:ABC-type transporter, permease protein (Nitrate/sulfonate/bicarbonate transporter) n=1 Tax=Desulforapulum autotrophicum (strain ATCC 43914 / DSM 3382 / VKM B-1955 / HRM2) TaxID=177437 RepID=C0QEA8_DESAH|nr:ABC transporter permease [Desulforapulum autotrophicum]ACN13225.1 ABC-type transporter, permease protein (nitrate/sulfonate/bicarbonate transporter) [Desulforapulum autotrophicum HRM2]
MSFLRRIAVPYAITILVVYLIWKVMAILLSRNVLPCPEDAVLAFFRALMTSEFWHHFAASTFRAVTAMVIGWAVAFPLGILMGSSRQFDKFLSPFVTMTYPIPKVVLLPVVLLLFGLGDFSKIIIISLILGYQVLVATRDGVRGIHPKHLDSIRSLGASKWQLFWEGYLPAALPHGFTALRLNSGVSVAVLFFVESFATTEGLGYLIMDAWGQMDFNAMFVGIFGMSLLGVILNEGSNFLEKISCPWH